MAGQGREIKNCWVPYCSMIKLITMPGSLIQHQRYLGLDFGGACWHSVWGFLHYLWKENFTL
jgi:hypothetical protein